MSDLFTLDWEGKHYELDVETITAREFKQIKLHTGLKAGPFIQSLNSIADMDADLAVGLLWLMKTRAGEPASFDDDLEVVKLLAALDRNGASGAEDEEVPKAEESEPTPG